jgi:hypothetical protein
MPKCNLNECCHQGDGTTVDREAGVIRGVKILGAESKNGRTYSPKAMKDAAAMYEGMGVNTNHPSRDKPGVERPIQDGIGWLEGVEVKADGVYGNLHIVKAHAMANSMFEIAERKPDRLGLSHNASGVTSQNKGKTVVESIESVRSVDIVQNPATNNSLFESEDTVTTRKTMTLKELTESLPNGCKERKALTALMEEDAFPMAGPDMPVDMTAMAGDAAPSSDQAAKDAFKSLIDAILDDDSITWAETQAKIKEAVAALAKMSGGDPVTETPETPPAEGEGETAMESLQEQVAALTKRLADKEADVAVRELLESKQVKVTPSRVATLKAVADKTVRTSLLEDWIKADGPKPKPVAGRPITSPPAVNLYESTSPGYKAPKGAEAMISAYR